MNSRWIKPVDRLISASCKSRCSCLEPPKCVWNGPKEASRLEHGFFLWVHNPCLAVEIDRSSVAHTVIGHLRLPKLSSVDSLRHETGGPARDYRGR